MRAAQLAELIRSNAEELRALNARILETARLRNRSPEDNENWETACRTFHSRYSALAFPGGYDNALERIAASEPAAVDAALCFLEVRPYFFRSGYMYKDILRKVKRAAVNKEQAARLTEIVAAYDKYRASRRREHAA